MTVARAIPTSLSGVVEHLELEGDLVVTLDSLRAALAAAGVENVSDEQTRRVAYKLQRAGWLGTLRTRNAWEFQPGARGGPFGSGDRFVEFRAYAATHPGWRGALAMESAATVLGLAQRLPDREVVVLPKGAPPPKALLAEWRVIASELSDTATVEISGLRLWSLEGLLVGIGERPSSYRDAVGLAQWLPEAVSRADIHQVLRLLEPMATAARQRVAYLFGVVGDEGSRDAVLGNLKPAQVAWFGPRRKGGLFDAKTAVNDTALQQFLSAGTGA